MGDKMKIDLKNDISSIKSICMVYEKAAKDIYDEVKKIEKEMNEFRACVPFIGEFSVGKSSLLNHWLGENLLPEDQGPTTALATELRYSEEQQAMYVVESETSLKKLNFLPKREDEANATIASNGLYAFCLSSSSRLKDIAPVIPVDMPGVNSSIKKHTKALYLYANRGAAFFFVFSPDQGTVSDTLATFLANLELKGRPVWIVLNKCDTATNEKIEAVSAEILDCCKELRIEPEGVLYTSRMYEKTPDEISDVLCRLNADELRDRTYFVKVQNLVFRLRNQLCTLKDACELDISDFDKRIRSCRRAKEDLEFAMERQEKSLRNRLDMLPEKVANDISRELNTQRSALAASLESSQEAFASHISGIINRVLTDSLEKNIEHDFRKFITELANQLQKIDTVEFSTETVEMMVRKICDVVKQWNGSDGGKNSEIGKIYKFVSTGLAVATNIISPIIELILIFLPEIISLLTGSGSRRNMIEEQLNNRVFPEISSEVKRIVANMIPEMRKNMIDSLHSEWLSQITDAEKALLNAQDEKKQALADADTQRDQLSNNIHVLDCMYHRFESLYKEF